MVSKNKEIVKIKQEIVDRYIEDFLDELSFLKKTVVDLSIKKKIKKIMLSDEDISNKDFNDLENLWFWKKIFSLEFVFGDLSDKIMDFLKEKKIELQKTNTKEELSKLAKEVLWKDIDIEDDLENEEDEDWEKWVQREVKPKEVGEVVEENTKLWEETNQESDEWSRNTILSWTIAGVWWVSAWNVTNKIVLEPWLERKFKSKLSGIDVSDTWKAVDKMKRNFDSMARYMEQQAKNSKNSSKMTKNYIKSAEQYKKLAKDFDVWAINAYDAWAKLWKSLPDDVLKTLPASTCKKILSLWDDFFLDLVENTQWLKNTEKTKYIKEMFSAKGINIWDDVARMFRQLDNAGDMMALWKVLWHAKKMKWIVKGLKAIMVFDLAFLWFDVWMFTDGLNEADILAKANEIRAKNRKNKAYFELSMWVASIVLEIALISAWVGSLWGPIWTAVWALVWVVIWWVCYWVQESINALYFDKRDFYTQNMENYIKQDRTAIKQAIVQVAGSNEKDENNTFAGLDIRQEWINTLHEAWRGLIFQEYILSGNYVWLSKWYESWQSKADYLKWLSEEEKNDFQEEEEFINKQIDARMEYVLPYLDKWNEKEYAQMITMLSSAQWIKMVERILVESRLNIDKKTDIFLNGKLPANTEEYKSIYEQNLKKESEEKFYILENYYKENQIAFEEIYLYIQELKLRMDEWDENYDVMSSNLEFVEKFYYYKTMDLSLEEKLSLSFNEIWEINYNFAEQVLLDIENINHYSNVKSTNEVKIYFGWTEFVNRKELQESISGNIWQDIVYRIAREFHWYSWKNDEYELMNYFSKKNNNTKWLYYDDWWYINDDWGIDDKFNFSDFEWKTVNKIMNSMFDLKHVDMINSAPKSMDHEINLEYFNKIKQIVWEEIDFSKEKNKKSVETEIFEYVDSKSKQIVNDWVFDADTWTSSNSYEEMWYIELPYYLLRKAKASGIWNVWLYLFKIEWWNLSAITIWSELNNSLDFSNYELQLEHITKLREKLTEQELEVVKRVDESQARLEQLRSVEWFSFSMRNHNDELDIPIELEKMISEKWHQWKNFVKNLYYIDPSVWITELKTKSQIYLSYFDNLYKSLIFMQVWFVFSNDIDDIELFNKALNSNNQEHIDIDRENWKISLKQSITQKWESWKWLDFLKNEDKFAIERVFNKQIENYKIHWDKTLLEMIKDNNISDNEIKYYSNKILVSIFEAMFLVYSKDGEFMNIRSVWTRNRDLVLSLTNNINSRLSINLSNQYANIEDMLGKIDKDSIPIKDQSKVEIDKDGKRFISEVKLALDDLLKTDRNVDWAGKRWELGLDLLEDDIIIKSRWQSVRIEKNTRKIKWLDIDFGSQKELILAANLINWFKWYYKEKNLNSKFEYDRWTVQNYKNWKLWDTDILSDDQVTKNYSFLKKWTNWSKFAEYLNS